MSQTVYHEKFTKQLRIFLVDNKPIHYYESGEYEELPKPSEYVQSEYSENMLNSMNVFPLSLEMSFLGSQFKIMRMSWYNSMKPF